MESGIDCSLYNSASELVSSSFQLNPSHFKRFYSYIRMTVHQLRHYKLSRIYGE